MIGLFCFALAVLGSPFKSKLWLEAENVVLRHQFDCLEAFSPREASLRIRRRDFSMVR
jgi:hypothetical protein